MNIITPSEVVDYAFTLREEISPASIKPAKIDVAIEKYAIPRFGEMLFRKFESGEYCPFVNEFLKPAIAYYVRYGVIDDLSIQMTDAGAVLYSGDEQMSKQTKLAQVASSEQSKDTGRDMTTSTQNVSSDKAEKSKAVVMANETGSKNQTDTQRGLTTGEKSQGDSVKKNSTTASPTDKTEMVFNENTTSDQNSKLNTEKTATLNTVHESSDEKTQTNDLEQITTQKTVADKETELRKEVSKTGERKGSDDSTAHVSRQKTQPATDFQRRVIRARALADANILMSKAVRYVERNVELFPEYEPTPRAVGRIVL